MIEIIGNTEVKNFWSYLSSYYNFLTEDQKKPIEDYWKALVDGIEALFYNLSEAYLSSSLVYSKGYLESRYSSIELDTVNAPFIKFSDIAVLSGTFDNPSNLDTETHLEYYVTGVQVRKTVEYETATTEKFVVTAPGLPDSYPITLTWNNLERIDYYYVYYKVLGDFSYKKFKVLTSDGSVTSGVFEYIQDGLETTSIVSTLNKVNDTIQTYLYNLDSNYYHVYIPTLRRVYNDTMLVLGTNYYVINYNQLGIYYDDTFLSTEEFELELDLQLTPIYVNLLQNIFRDETLSLSDILDSGAYSSHLAYSGLTEYNENRLMNLFKLSCAIILKVRQGLTNTRLADVISLYHNVPFSYEAGTIAAGSVSGNYTIGDYEYVVPSGLTLKKEIGDSVAKYEVLCNGCEIADYVSNSYLLNIIGSGNAYYSTIGIKVPPAVSNLNYYKPYVDYVNDKSKLLSNILQPGLLYEYYTADMESEEAPEFTEHTLDMTNYALGVNSQFSNSWTRIDSKPYTTYSIINDSGKVFYNISTASGFKYASWNTPVLCKDLEFSYEIKVTNGQTFAGFGFRLGPNTSGRDFYFIGLKSAVDTVDPMLAIFKVIDDIPTSISESAYGWLKEDWYTIKGSIVGTNLKAKIWASNGTEPEDWTIEIVNANIATTGLVCFVNNGTNGVSIKNLYIKRFN